MSLDIEKIAKDMAIALVSSLSGTVPTIEAYATSEALKLGHSLAQIETLYVSGQINQKTSSLLLDIQKNSTRIVFLTIEGLGLLAVEAAINAALAVVGEVVNTALGFKLI